MRRGSVVLGYLREVQGGANAAEHEAMIEETCGRRGWRLAAVLRDEPSQDPIPAAMEDALRRLAAGEAGGLVVASLDSLSRSVHSLAELLPWFDRAGATLVAADVGLDTSTRAGRVVARVMGSVANWERRATSVRTRDGLASKPRRGDDVGRPSILEHEELRERIVAMRGEGLSLQAICDTLNAEQVPTLRGGERWRPSSIQRALGYRRPPQRRSGLELPDPRPPRSTVTPGAAGGRATRPTEAPTPRPPPGRQGRGSRSRSSRSAP